MRTMGTSVQAAAFDGLANEAAALALEVSRYREHATAGRWGETRRHAFGQLESFHRRLRSIGLRRAELMGSGL